MSHKELHSRLLNRTILGLMNKIEDETGLMFHEYDSELDKRCFEVMDSKSASKQGILVTHLETVLDRLYNVPKQRIAK